MLKQRFSQKLLQKLSPQQIQLMKLLQVPTVSLEQRIKDELEANPALEEGKEADEDYEQEQEEREKEENKEEEIDIDEYLSDDEPDYKYSAGGYSSSDEEKVIPIPLTKTFHEHLLQQLGTIDIKGPQQQIVAEQIVGSIDDDGYLRRDIAALINDLAFSQNIETTEEEVLALLKKIQKFDPPGIGARDLRECLLLQLERKKTENPEAELAEKILSNHFEAFTKKHYQRLMKQMGISEEALKNAIEEILKLNPKPGSGYSGNSRTTHYVVPDFFIKNNNGELELELNSMNAPFLKVNKDFKEMLKGYKAGGKKDKDQKQAVMFIKQKLEGAKWFIDAIRQRQATLLGVMSTLIEYQKNYLLTGDETNLRPMILKDIAERTGLDISTVSRVANSKYVQTEWGVLSLKYFFSESLQTESGEEVSTREVKNILQQMVDGESKKKPLSDQKLMEALKEKGYNIARRTVAKYREQLNIPVARLRKKL